MVRYLLLHLDRDKSIASDGIHPKVLPRGIWTAISIYMTYSACLKIRFFILWDSFYSPEVLFLGVGTICLLRIMKQ